LGLNGSSKDTELAPSDVVEVALRIEKACAIRITPFRGTLDVSEAPSKE
jgi:hypothetical protein